MTTHAAGQIRRHQQRDAEATAQTFQAAISTTAARYYSPEQIRAWRGGDIDLAAWNQRRLAAWTVVAELDDEVVGFSDLTPAGVLDMLFVHPRVGGRGIARRLVEAVLDEARARGLGRVDTQASRAARPALERCGFVVDAENPDKTVRGVTVPNYAMHIGL